MAIDRVAQRVWIRYCRCWDHEHRELVTLINELHNSLGAGADHARISEFLGEAFAKIAAHFAHEETVMRKHHYDEYEHSQTRA